MSLARSSQLLPLVQSVVVPKRGYRHILVGPPKRPISTGEFILHGSIMAVMGLSIPAWVLYHLKEYQGRA